MSFSAHYSWDFLSGEEIEERTIRALRNHIAFLKESSPFYGEALLLVDSEKITSLRAFAEVIPLTEKEDFSDGGKSFQVASEQQIVETVVTSGSTGDPLFVPLTSADVDRVTYNEALSFNNAGVTSADKALVLEKLDTPKISGMAHYRGLTLLGVNTTRAGAATSSQQQEYFKALSPTLLVGAPSILKSLGRALVKSGDTIEDCSVQRLFCVEEPIRDAHMELTDEAKELESIFGAEVFSSYSSTEMATTFCDCEKRSGGHIHPELLYAEIVDEDGNVVADGDVGELVITPLGIQGMPILRLRTGDITFKVAKPCSCGRSSMQIGPILSRTTQTVAVKGKIVNLRAVTNLLDSYSFMNDYLVELQASSAGDEIFIHVAMPAQEVGMVMRELMSATGVKIPVLVTNSPTINSMRGEEQEKCHLLDKRPLE